MERLSDEAIDMMEINILLPECQGGRIVLDRTRKLWKRSLLGGEEAGRKHPVIMKLSPECLTDITEMAKGLRRRAVQMSCP